MRYYFILLCTVALLWSCQSKETIPTDVEGLKTLVKAKSKEYKELGKEIEDLEARILKLEPPKEKSKKHVTSFVLEPEVFKSFTELQGNVVSSEAAMLSAEMGGRITSLTLNEGDYIRRGQVVGTIDMESVKKSVQELETALDLAQSVYERQQRLWNQQIGSEIQYLQAKNNKERLEKSLATAKSQLAKESIVSPLSGYVERKFLKGGEITGPGTPIASIINTSTVKAVVDVPENMIKDVRRGASVTLEFPALNTTRKARINKIGRSINPANRTFPVEINLSNPKGILKPNLMVLTKLNNQTIKNALLIPTELVQQDVSGKNYVYTIAEGEEGTYAQKNIVETGDFYNGKVLITSGLSAGDPIINVGARGLAADELIQVENKN